MEKDPLVSVLLPVYNAAPYVQEAIESILSQTYRRFELIIVNDGSTDGSGQIIKAMHDPRIRIIEQRNRGLSVALNRAIAVAQGAYLARQDADDISLPRRFERQVEFLEEHSTVGMVGTWAEIRSHNPSLVKVYAPPSDSALLKFELLFDNPFVHSSMMIRRQAIEQVGAYDEGASVRAEDYELWSRVAQKCEVGNLPETLHIYRDAPNSKLKKERDAISDNVIDISIRNLSRITQRERNDPAINDLSALSHGAYRRVHGHTTIENLTALIVEAADRLHSAGQGFHGLLQDSVQAHCRTLRHHYDLYDRYYKERRYWQKVLQLSEMVKRAILPRRSSAGHDH